MKTAWNVLAVVALANLIALAGLVGWLRASDRLDMDRARQIRSMLSRTIAQDRAEAARSKSAEEEAARAQAEAAKQARPAMTAAEKLAERIGASELDFQRIERLKREVLDLQHTLVRERAELDREKVLFEADRRQLLAQASQSEDEAGVEQFQKTLGVLQSLRPAAAKAMLLEIMNMPDGSLAQSTSAPVMPNLGANQPADVGAFESVPAGPTQAGTQAAVEYLNAMDERSRAKVMTEFAKSDPRLAAQLLESLRRRGQFARIDAGNGS